MKFVLIVVSALLLTSTVYAQDILHMNWFTMQDNGYNVKFTFHYFEDQSPDTPLAELTMSCNGTYTVTNINPYRELSFTDIVSLVDMFAQDMGYVWANEDELAWSQGMPQQWQLTEMPLKPECLTTYLPVAMNN